VPEDENKAKLPEDDNKFLSVGVYLMALVFLILIVLIIYLVVKRIHYKKKRNKEIEIFEIKPIDLAAHFEAIH